MGRMPEKLTETWRKAGGKAYKDASARGGFSSRITENAYDSFLNRVMRTCCGHTWQGLQLVRLAPPTLQPPSLGERLFP